MNQYWLKSVILHISILLFLALGSLQMCSRKDEEIEEVTVTVDLMPIGEKNNVKPAPKQEEEKPKPSKKPEPEKEKEPEKEPEKKPEPKKPEPKPEPKEEPKKPEKPKEKAPDPKELDELLKTLEETKPTPKAKSNQTENTDAKSKSETLFDPNAPLTVTEMSYIATIIMKQIQPCWNIPAGARDAGSLKIKLAVDVERDGRIRFIEFADEALYNSDPYYQVAADSARRAVLDPRCNPLRQLPPMEKFNKWHQLTLTFDPSKLIY